MNLQVRVLLLGAFLANVVIGWECNKPGRFPDPEEDEESCQQYVTCIPGPDGSFSTRNDECNPGSLFSAKYQRCISGESCDTLEDFYSIEYDCKECGKFVNVNSQDCRQFINCLKSKDPGVYIPIKQSCPKMQVFSAKTSSCVDESEYQCPPIVLKFLSDFVCLDVGSFPDESVPNCRGYRVCSKLRNSTLVSKNFLCENDTVYSEIERKCVPPSSYDCPDDGISDFECPGVGRYPDKVSKTCETYYSCVENSKGELKPTLLTCTGGTIFSAITSKCVAASEYVCPSTLAELELKLEEHVVGSSEPTMARRVASEEEVSICTESGRFANEEDGKCHTYYLCSRDPSGNWFKVIVRCPAGFVFSPERERCVDSKEFACPVMTTVPITITTTTVPAATMTSTVPIIEDSTAQCSGVGRILNTEDPTCRSYYLCSFNSDYELKREVISCPLGSLFSNKFNKCVKDDGTMQCLSASDAAIFEESGDGADSPNTAELINTTIATSYQYPCTATGRFADINSVDCRSYFLCSEDKSGSIVSVHLNCPIGMVFSRNTNKCVISTKYLC